jgi:hypothetical protein
MINKVVYVPACWAPIGEYKAVAVPTREKKTGVFGGEKDVARKEQQWVQTGQSDCDIDAERLVREMQDTIAVLNSDGYEIVAVTPVIAGNYNSETQFSGIGNHATC